MGGTCCHEVPPKEEVVLHKETSSPSKESVPPSTVPVHSGPAYEVIVKMLSGQEIKLQMRSSDTISDLMTRVYAVNGLDPKIMKMMFLGKTLEEGATLDACKVTAGSKVRLIVSRKMR